MALIELLTRNYTQSPEVADIQGTFDHIVNMVISNKEDMFRQFNLESATWGLEKWERMTGLETDLAKSYEFRRERISAKLRGRGTTTKQMVKDVAMAYSNGEVEVIEDPVNYSFKIKFVGTKGLPPNMADLTLTIEEIKPAHLAFEFEYVYRTHAELFGYTHEELKAYTHAELREGVIS